MKMVCPACGAISSAEAWKTDAQARQCMKIIALLPRAVAKGALNYISLFRPQNSNRGLAWGKALRLLGELQVIVDAAHVQWQKQVARPVNPQLWGLGLEKMISDPPRRLPLTSHNYLRAIVYDLANESDREKEVQHNKKERNGTLVKPRHVETPKLGVSTEHQADSSLSGFLEAEGVGSLRELIKKKKKKR